MSGGNADGLSYQGFEPGNGRKLASGQEENQTIHIHPSGIQYIMGETYGYYLLFIQ